MVLHRFKIVFASQQYYVEIKKKLLRNLTKNSNRENVSSILVTWN